MKHEFLRLCPYGEKYLEQLVKKCRKEVLLLGLLAVIVVSLWNGFFEESSKMYVLESVFLALYLVVMEVPAYHIQSRENKIYKELLTYLSRVKHRYLANSHVANAVLDAAENMSYELQRLAGEVYGVLMGSNRKEDVRDYILYHRTNRYLKLFLIQAYEASEKGDVILSEGNSLFAENVEHLRLELMEELYRRKRQSHEFAGYVFVAVAPLFLMPVLKGWGLDFTPELEFFYAGTGQILELATFLTTIIIYGWINKAKEIALFRGNHEETMWNMEVLYDNTTVRMLIRHLEQIQGNISNKVRHLLLISGERSTYGNLCFKRLILTLGSFLLLVLFVTVAHLTERRMILSSVPAIDTIAPVASKEKQTMLTAYILQITKECIGQEIETSEEIRTALREKSRLSNETMEQAVIQEIQSKIIRYKKGRITLWEVAGCLFISIWIGSIPVIRLWLQVQAAKAGAVHEVKQFQSVILIERKLQGTTIVGLLEDMEIFSQSFRNVLQKCINTYGMGPKEALLQMKEEGKCLHESFEELADAFLSVDDVGIEIAFAEVESNRRLLEKMNLLENEMDLERKKDNTDILAKIPMVLAVGAYFILPFFAYSLKGVYEVFEILENLRM